MAVQTKLQRQVVDRLKMRNSIKTEGLSSQNASVDTDYIPSIYKVEAIKDCQSSITPGQTSGKEYPHTVLMSMVHNTKERQQQLKQQKYVKRTKHDDANIRKNGSLPSLSVRHLTMPKQHNMSLFNDSASILHQDQDIPDDQSQSSLKEIKLVHTLSRTKYGFNKRKTIQLNKLNYQRDNCDSQESLQSIDNPLDDYNDCPKKSYPSIVSKEKYETEPALKENTEQRITTKTQAWMDTAKPQKALKSQKYQILRSS